jgi:hypothetical protein
MRTHRDIVEENASALWVLDNPDHHEAGKQHSVCTEANHKEALQNQFFQLIKRRVMQ